LPPSHPLSYHKPLQPKQKQPKAEIFRLQRSAGALSARLENPDGGGGAGGDGAGASTDGGGGGGVSGSSSGGSSPVTSSGRPSRQLGGRPADTEELAARLKDLEARLGARAGELAGKSAVLDEVRLCCCCCLLVVECLLCGF
jgi:hypothetical protein